MNSLVLLSGGARSGKSSYAEKLAHLAAEHLGISAMSYLATGDTIDLEFTQRIEHHRASRSKNFVTFEEPLYLDQGLTKALEVSPIVVLECISTWLGNVFHHFPDRAETFARQEIEACIARIQTRDQALVFVVSNELGMGLVPADAVSRHYRDVHGRINCQLAAAAHEAWFVVSGLPLRLK